MGNFNFSQEDKKVLLRIARRSIEDGLNRKGEDFLESSELAAELTENLKVKAGAFVTLKSGGEQLRGCIGNFVSNIPVYANVYRMAKEAAFSDPRFNPLENSELKEIKLEISVLSPLEKIDDIKKIEVGRHGLYIIKGRYRGVLLPQVATENNMDRTEFLEAVSIKAGLPRDGYKEGADILVFSAEVFGE